MKQQVMPRPSLEQAGLSLWKFCFWKPLVHKRALTNLDPLLPFSVISHLKEMHPWPLLLISSYTPFLFHCVSSFNIASSCCILFVVINVSWTCVSSSFSLCSERLDRHLVRSFSQFDVSLLGVSSKIWYWCTLDRSMNICRPLLVSTFQQFE